MPLAEGEFAGLTHVGSGKVRELFAVGADSMLLVATDRLSVFDVIMPTPIPDKGAVLTGLSVWWFDQLADVVPSHLLSARVADFPAELAPHAAALRGRSMLCRRLDMVALECVVRGYLAGGGFRDYTTSGAVSGHDLPAGLLEGDRFPEPLFTPSTKAELGEHDEAISREQAATAVGAELAAELEHLTLAVYRRAAELAAAAGLLLADTKLEFGHDADGVLRLGDEVLTPDSSRFWPAAGWSPGGPQPSYDKEFLREWLTVRGLAGQAVELPEEVVEATRTRYVEAYELLTGSSFDSYLRSS